MTTNDDATTSDPQLMAAVTDLGTAVRELIEASVVTTVDAGALRSAAELVRAATSGIAVSRRPGCRRSTT